MKWLERLRANPGAEERPASVAEVDRLPASPFPQAPLHVPRKLSNPLSLPPLTLAYVGDSVYELFVRSRLLERGQVKVKDLHKGTIGYVRAGAQARTLAEIYTTLTPQEQDVVRRGRNAKGHAAPKGSDPAEYAASTAFEALLGFLYLKGDEHRLGEVLSAAARQIEGDA